MNACFLVHSMWLIVAGIPAGRPVGVPDNHLWPLSDSLRTRHVGVSRQAGDERKDGQIQAEFQVVEKKQPGSTNQWSRSKQSCKLSPNPKNP